MSRISTKEKEFNYNAVATKGIIKAVTELRKRESRIPFQHHQKPTTKWFQKEWEQLEQKTVKTSRLENPNRL